MKISISETTPAITCDMWLKPIGNGDYEVYVPTILGWICINSLRKEENKVNDSVYNDIEEIKNQLSKTTQSIDRLNRNTNNLNNRLKAVEKKLEDKQSEDK